MSNPQPLTNKAVTDYIYCPSCGIDLPRPPLRMVGSTVRCPCCDDSIRIAHPLQLWCEHVSILELPPGASIALAGKLGHR
jgi:hypothetical protein